MKKLSATSIAFFDYINGLRRYFGNKVLTTMALFTLYLNYDTENNIIRKAIISMIPNVTDEQTKKEINERL